MVGLPTSNNDSLKYTLYLSDCIFILELSRLLDNNSNITEVLYGEQSIVDTGFLTKSKISKIAMQYWYSECYFNDICL
jgi:hypothetical protein